MPIKSVFVLLVVFLYACNEQNTTDSNKFVEIRGVRYQEMITLKELPKAYPITAPISGKIETIHTKPSYRRKEVLARLNNKNSFEDYSDKFTSFQRSLTNCIDHFPSELNSLAPEWKSFLSKLSVQQTPPPLPKIGYRELFDHLDAYDIQSKYKAWINAYLIMENFFIASPEAGFVTEWKIRKNQQIKKGEVVAMYFPKNIQLIYPLNNSILDSPKRIDQAFANQGFTNYNLKIETDQIICKLSLKRMEDHLKIPLEIPSCQKQYRFIVPEKAVVKGTVTYFSDKKLTQKNSIQTQRINGNHVILLPDSVIYFNKRVS
jgi:hypothetical protein